MIKIKDYYVPETDLHFINYLKKYDNYQEAQRNRAISYVEDWQFAIDIGANIGLWSKDLSKYDIFFPIDVFPHKYLIKTHL